MSDFLIVYGRSDWTSSIRRRISADQRDPEFHRYEDGSVSCLLAFDSNRGPWRGARAIDEEEWIVWVGDPRSFDSSQGDVTLTKGDQISRRFRSLYQESGCNPLTHTHGPVALARWDAKRMKLECARDKLGEVILTYTQSEAGVLISSNINWLYRVSKLDGDPNLHLLSDRLWNAGGSSERDDYITGIKRIRPSELAIWDRDFDIKFRDYWNPDFAPFETEPVSYFRNELKRVIESVDVENSLVSMSGGVDSQLLAVLFQRHSDRDELPVISQVAPGVPFVDENPAISEAEAALPVDVHRFDVTDAWNLDRLEALTNYMASGPLWMGGEVFNQPFHDWALSRFDRSNIVIGSFIEFGLKPYGWSGLALESLRSGGFEEWERFRRLRGEISLIKAFSKIFLDSLGLRSRATAIYRRLIGFQSATIESKKWNRRQDWLEVELRSEAEESKNVFPIGQREFGERKFHFLRSWRWENSMRLKERSMRRCGRVIYAPYVDDRVWQCLLKLPPSLCIEKRVVRRAARNEMPQALAERRTNQHFTPLSGAGLTTPRAVQWVLDLISTGYCKRFGLLNKSRFERAYLDFVSVYRGVGKFAQDQPQISWLRQTISVEHWLQWLKETDSVKPKEWSARET